VLESAPGNKLFRERFQVATAPSLKTLASWDTEPRSLEVYRRFRDAYYLHNQGDKNSAGVGQGGILVGPMGKGGAIEGFVVFLSPSTQY
jgi:hypothetical protein